MHRSDHNMPMEAQRRTSSIDLPILNLGTRWDWESAPRPASFIPGKEPRYLRRLGGAQGSLEYNVT
jgi:hypothetical protein